MLTKDQIREKMLSYGKKTAYFEGTLPGLEDLDGKLSIRELSAADASAINDLAKTEGGYSNALDIGATLARGLITRESKERIYGDLDAQAVSELGLSILKPIVEKIKELSGMTPDAVTDAKKNSQLPQASSSDSASPSTETVAQPVQAEASMSS